MKFRPQQDEARHAGKKNLASMKALQWQGAQGMEKPDSKVASCASDDGFAYREGAVCELLVTLTSS